MTLKNCEPPLTIPPFISALHNPMAQPWHLRVQSLPPKESKKDVSVGAILGQTQVTGMNFPREQLGKQKVAVT